MKIANTPHTTWISSVKKGGKIHGAYCTCAAEKVLVNSG